MQTYKGLSPTAEFSVKVLEVALELTKKGAYDSDEEMREAFAANFRAILDVAGVRISREEPLS